MQYFYKGITKIEKSRIKDEITSIYCRDTPLDCPKKVYTNL